MTERRFVAPDGRTWTARVRPTSRKGEAKTHVVLELESGSERLVATCPRAEWDGGELDVVALLARAVPGGAGRNLASGREPSEGT